MIALHRVAAGAALLAVTSAPTFAQDKPTVGKYVAEGYDVIHIEGGGGQFVSFILKKDKTLVHCNVVLQSGETSSCRTIK